MQLQISTLFSGVGISRPDLVEYKKMWAKYNKRALQAVFAMKADINGHGWEGRELFAGSGIRILK